MITNKNHFLKELTKTPALINNTIAFVFANNPDINISSREKFYDNITTYYNIYRDNKPNIIQLQEEQELELNSWAEKDLRIKSIRLSGVRGIPVSEKPFGIDLADESGQPQSMIILGGNSVGKSSVYEAIEFCYCNKIGEAQLRDYIKGADGKINYIKYLQHFDNPNDKIFIEIDTPSQMLKYGWENIPSEIRARINPDSHFISDYDIYTKGQIDYDLDSSLNNPSKSFHNMIAESLGFTELLQFEKHLKQFTLYKRLTETRNISSTQKSIDNQKELITSTEKSIREKEQILKSLTNQIQSITLEKGLHDTINKINQLIISDVAYSYDSKLIINSCNNYLNAYKEFISKELEQSSYNEIEFLKLGLNLIHEKDDCPFCRQSKLAKSELQKDVEIRIDKMIRYNENIQRVNHALELQVNTLVFFYNSINNLLNSINSEILQIKNDVQLNELYILENDFIKESYKIINSDLFYEISRLNDNNNYLINKHEFIYNLISIHKEFIDSNVINYIHNAVNFIQKRLGIIRTIQKRLTASTEIKTIGEQIAILNKEIEVLKTQIIKSNNNIESDTKYINELLKTQDNFNEIKEEVSQYLNIFHAKLNEEINSVFDPMKQIVQEILEYYFKLDRRDVTIRIEKQPDDIDIETKEIISEIITAQIISTTNSFNPQSPTKYLNSFHFRLFCSIVSISIAIALRKNTKINLPLVWDDIFIASDFENTATIVKFLKKIFDIFEKFTYDMPLQLLIFTHDHLIFRSAMDAFDDIYDKRIIFSKLFKSSEAYEEANYKNLVNNFFIQPKMKIVNKSNI